MNKIISLAFLILLALSCKNYESNTDYDLKLEDSQQSRITNDKDEKGCLISAGYIWSKINKECIRVFTGIQLNPKDNPDNEDVLLSAFLLFDEEGTKAEIFLPKETTSIVLENKKKGKLWANNLWKLELSDGYILKKEDEIIFQGDVELGKKVIESDIEK